jgi:NTE family protein
MIRRLPARHFPVSANDCRTGDRAPTAILEPSREHHWSRLDPADARRRRPIVSLSLVASIFLAAGCATRPVNPPITQFDRAYGYQSQTRIQMTKDPDNLVILAFSGGGTRAAAFSYGVLEVLRRTYVTGPRGNRFRLLDGVDIITGVSGGSFTALAYGLYGERLFDEYEKRFLKRNVQGELISRSVNPLNWGALSSIGWGRSELAAKLYDEILFDNATFDDLRRKPGPLIAVLATDLSTGSRVPFLQNFFDVLCSDLGPMHLARAAAASSAVPVVLSPVTINNYGGTCHYAMPDWARPFTDPADVPRPAARTVRRFIEVESYNDSTRRPYLHLVDGGVSDNLGLRSVLDFVEGFEAAHMIGQPTPLDHVRRIIVIVVNSVSFPRTNWDESETAPNSIQIMLKASGVPIDRYSFESVELLRDITARWQTLRRIRDSSAFAKDKDASLKEVINAPNIDLYAIDVSFSQLKDQAELDYLNDLTTSFTLPDEAVDRLRAAAGRILLESPDFKRLLKEVGATIVDDPQSPVRGAPAPAGAAAH